MRKPRGTKVFNCGDATNESFTLSHPDWLEDDGSKGNIFALRFNLSNLQALLMLCRHTKLCVHDSP